MEIRDETGRIICGAKTKHGPCRNSPLVGRTRCKFHGGMNPTGIAAPNYKDGRYSPYVPKKLLDVYVDSLYDPHKLELNSEISLVEARLSELLQRVDRSVAYNQVEALRREYKVLKEALARGDLKGATFASDAYGTLLDEQYSDYAAWQEIINLVDQRRRLVESERKRLVEANLVVTSEEALRIVTGLLQAVKTYVTDKKVLANIQAEFTKLVGKL